MVLRRGGVSEPGGGRGPIREYTHTHIYTYTYTHPYICVYPVAKTHHEVLEVGPHARLHGELPRQQNLHHPARACVS